MPQIEEFPVIEEFPTIEEFPVGDKASPPSAFPRMSTEEVAMAPAGIPAFDRPKTLGQAVGGALQSSPLALVPPVRSEDPATAGALAAAQPFTGLPPELMAAAINEAKGLGEFGTSALGKLAIPGMAVSPVIQKGLSLLFGGQLAWGAKNKIAQAKNSQDVIEGLMEGAMAPVVAAGALPSRVEPPQFQGPLATGEVLPMPRGSPAVRRPAFQLPDTVEQIPEKGAPDAIRIQSANEIPVQPAPRSSQAVAQGIPEAKPEEAAGTQTQKPEAEVAPAPAVRLVGTKKTAPWPYALVSKNPTGEGWRLSWFSEFGGEKNPQGHKDFATRDEALQEAKDLDFEEVAPAPAAELSGKTGELKPEAEPAAETGETKAPVAEAKPSLLPPKEPGESPQLGGGAAEAGEIIEGTGLKNAVGEMERAGLDLPEAYPTTRKNMAAAWVKAGELEAKAPGAGKKLADDLIQNPERGLTDEDSALLLRHKVDLFNQINDAAEKTHSFDPNVKAKAEADYARLTQDYTLLLDTVKFRGSQWGREGRWRQAMAKEDYDFSSTDGMNRYHKAHTGQDFTPEQKTRAEKVAKVNKQAKDDAATARERMNDYIRNKTGEAPPVVDVKVKSLADRIVSALDKTANDALSRIRARRAQGAAYSGGIDPADLDDYAIYGASKIAKGAVEFGAWSAEMVKDIGDYIKPHLKQIWDAADKKLDEEIGKVAPPESRDSVKKQVRSPAGRGTAEADRRAFDAANKTVREWAVKVAEQSNKTRVARTVQERELAKVQEERTLQQLQQATDAARDAAVKLAEAENKARESKAGEKPPTDQLTATQKALDAASKTVRDAAKRMSDAENKQRTARAGREKAAADTQVKAARKAMDAANKRIIQAAEAASKAARKLQDDPILRVWTKAREYLDKGEENFDRIRNKIATDLGMKVDQVTRLMAQDARAKYLADDLWLKQQKERQMKVAAKRWVDRLDMPGYQKAIDSLPRILFSLRVGFHGTVALGTHAPTVAFQPRFWAAYVRDFGKMYRMVASPKYYERQIQDIQLRGNYATARRAGLVNDPTQYEEYHVAPMTGRLAEIAPKVADTFNNLTRMGNRGYAVLKILRQDMFDQVWNQLPKTQQIPEMAKAIADGINHATGVVKGQAPKGTNIALFAPRLEASRVMWLAGDPIKAADTLLNWKNATEGEKAFALNQVKEKAWVMGTLGTILAMNQGVLSATNSKQKINFTDPFKTDFLKFKAAGLNVSYGNPMITMARLPLRLWVGVKNEGKLNKIIFEDENTAKTLFDYARSQASPFASLTLDLGLGRDYAGRPLPRAAFGLLPGKTTMPKRLKAQGTLPYTWKEFWALQSLPIPFQEGMREVWGKDFGLSEAEIQRQFKALATISFMSATGGRVSEDIPQKGPPSK